MLLKPAVSRCQLWNPMVFVFVLCVAFAPIGCAGPANDVTGEHAAGNAADEAEGGEHADEGGEHGDEGGEGVQADADAEPAEDIPSRAAEVERDEYSKPAGVFDFVGIEAGDTVIDVAAGGGYNTYLLAERVGSSGKVIAAEGNNDGLAVRLDRGDMSEATNVEIAGSLADIADASVDSVVVIRWYHLLPDPPAFVAELNRIMKPGGTVGVVEVRLNQDEGHDMTSHRVGEQTVIADFEGGGFAYDGESDILRRDDDDYTLYWGPHGKRYMTDRMLLKFSKAR